MESASRCHLLTDRRIVDGILLYGMNNVLKVVPNQLNPIVVSCWCFWGVMWIRLVFWSVNGRIC